MRKTFLFAVSLASTSVLANCSKSAEERSLVSEAETPDGINCGELIYDQASGECRIDPSVLKASLDAEAERQEKLKSDRVDSRPDGYEAALPLALREDEQRSLGLVDATTPSLEGVRAGMTVAEAVRALQQHGFVKSAYDRLAFIKGDYQIRLHTKEFYTCSGSKSVVFASIVDEAMLDGHRVIRPRNSITMEAYPDLIEHLAKDHISGGRAPKVTHGIAMWCEEGTSSACQTAGVKAAIHNDTGDTNQSVNVVLRGYGRDWISRASAFVPDVPLYTTRSSCPVSVRPT